MQRRAESQEQTRLRITESAVELHGTVGPARTSISAVAAQAGVRRSTVYRHFPDEAALLDACSAHWSAANPPPDLGALAAIGDPDERLGVALGELHAFYGRTEPMLENLFRDETTVPLLQERFAAFHDYLDAARDTLMAGRRLRGASRRRTRAALGHAIAFSTWKSLVREQGLNDADTAALLSALVAGADPRER
ncbi:MAG: TetR/AcrR family transcriptional regulator [Solirubrobacterales bacterium]|nr:TetR/AcrR family transcriptional regulator [Solirubrobacterales bacterium]